MTDGICSSFCSEVNLVYITKNAVGCTLFPRMHCLTLLQETYRQKNITIQCHSNFYTNVDRLSYKTNHKLLVLHHLCFVIAPQLPYVSIDFDRWEVWSSSEEDEGDDNTNARAEPTNPSNSQRDSATNPSNSRRDSDDKGRSKQVFLPEMLVSDSDSDEESVASDIDYLDFR